MEESTEKSDFPKPLGFPDSSFYRKINITKALSNRQVGHYKGRVPYEFQRAAEDKLVEKEVLQEMTCELPDFPKSTFLMVFSPDGKKVASTHGNHNVYVTDLTTGRNIQTLCGHPRTPWCIAFHPSSNQILASGCLGGQVRVWDLSGGSEVWTAESQTVIASLAFHPTERMLVIATYNELHFWDWSQPEPFARCSTKTDREKVRYVTFDRLGNKLITGIANAVAVQSQWDRTSSGNMHGPPTTSSGAGVATTSAAVSSSATTNSTSTVAASAPQLSDQERSIAFCYRNLMNQYNQLVRRYFDLSRSRATPTMDRGTDPMEIHSDAQSSMSSTQTERATSSNEDQPSTSGTQSQGATSETSANSTAGPSRADLDESSSSGCSSDANSSPNPAATENVGLEVSVPMESGSAIGEMLETSDDSMRVQEMLRDVVSSESQSGEDTELEMAARSGSPRAVVSRTDTDPDHPRPVPTFQLRPRLLQDPSYQFLANRETFGNTSGGSTRGAARFVMRPNGQFVLSRHSNSPFQPRVPLRVDAPAVTSPPSTAPAIPSRVSSFSPAQRRRIDVMRAVLADRMQSMDPSNSDTTTNFSRLAREADAGADTGPDFSWDADSETLIIRPRENAGPTETATPPAVSNGATQDATQATSNEQPALSARDPLAPYFEDVNRHLENLQSLVRARVELIRIREMRSTLRNLRNNMNAIPSNEPGSAASATESGAEESFESHLRGQVQRLRSLVSELRRGIEGVVRFRDVSAMLQSASLNDTPASSAPTSPPAPPPSSCTDTCLQKLATVMARELMRCPVNWQPQPGPSTANPSQPDENDSAILEQLKTIVLRVALRRFTGESASGESQTGPSQSDEIRVHAPVVRSSEATGDSFREPASNWRALRARIEEFEGSQNRQSSINRLRGIHRDTSRELFRVRIKRTVRDAMRDGILRLGLKEALDRRFLNMTQGNTPQHSSSTGRTSNAGSTASTGDATPGSGAATVTEPSSRDTCRSCGLRKTGSSLKRKTLPPLRFRADKIPRSSGSRRTGASDSTTQILQNMIDRMQSMVRMQREVPDVVTMTSEDRALVNEINDEVQRAGLQLRIRTPHLIRSFRQNVAQLRAHQILNTMVHTVSSFFEGTSSTDIVDREIMRLYSLLQLALELTDLLLEQFQSSRNASSDTTNTTMSNPEPEVNDEDSSVPLQTPDSTTAVEAGQQTSENNESQLSNCDRELLRARAERWSNYLRAMYCSDRSTSDTNSSAVTSMVSSTTSTISTGSRMSTSTTGTRTVEGVTNSSTPTNAGARSNVRSAFSSSQAGLSGLRRCSVTVSRVQLPVLSHSTVTAPTSSVPSVSARPLTVTRVFQFRGHPNVTARSPSGRSTSPNVPRARSFPAVRRLPETTSDSSNLENQDANRVSNASDGGENEAATGLAGISRVWPAPFRRALNYGRQVALATAHRQASNSEEQEIPRGARTAAMHRYRRSRLQPVARMSTSYVVGVRRQRPVFRVAGQPRYHVYRNNVESEVDDPSHEPPIPRLLSRSWRTMFVTGEASDDQPASARSESGHRAGSSTDPGFVVPTVRVNDVPVSDTSTFNTNSSRSSRSSTSPQTPAPAQGEELSRWRFYRPRFLHPRYLGPNPFDEQDTENNEQPSSNFYRYFNPATGLYTDPIMISEAPLSPHHRIQAWNFSQHDIPDISNRELNGVVAECKIHNDASVDVSSDGCLLVTLLPSGRLSVTTMLGVYSLEWSSLGQLLYKTGFEQNAVSVSLSPTARHLLVGLASRPLALRERDHTNMAQIFRLSGAKPTPKGSWQSGIGYLQLVRDLEQPREMNFMSLNCIRWAPEAGCGLVYGTNTGQLKVLR